MPVSVRAGALADILLVPRRIWDDAAACDAWAKVLVKMFARNFGQYKAHIDTAVKAVATGARETAAKGRNRKARGARQLSIVEMPTFATPMAAMGKEPVNGHKCSGSARTWHKAVHTDVVPVSNFVIWPARRFL